jgi:hypothetical protein
MFTTPQPQAPQTVRETIHWLLRLGRPPLPECPIEAAKQGKEPKQPCFLDGKYLKTVNWKQWQEIQPLQEILDAWFSNPKTGIGTLGGWNGKHWLGWIDFDRKDFPPPMRAIAQYKSGSKSTQSWKPLRCFGLPVGVIAS